MKTTSKVLSMFLVVVMCFGLFTTSAFATDLLAGGNESAGAGSDILAGSAAGAAGNDDLLQGEPVEREEMTFTAADTPDLAANTGSGADLAAPAANNSADGDLLSGAANAANAADEKDILNTSLTTTFNNGLDPKETETFEAAPSETYIKGTTKDIDIPLASPYETTSIYTYSTNKTALTGTALKAGTDFIIVDDADAELTISFLNGLSNGTWYFHEHKADGSAELILTLFVQESSSPDPSQDFGTLDVKWNTHNYNRNDSGDIILSPGSTSVNFATWFSGYAYSPNDVWASPMYSIGSGSYYIEGKQLHLRDSFLKSLEDGTWYLWGYKTDAYGNISGKINLGYFTVTSGAFNTKWTLTPDGQVWYSGTDPLSFYSSLYKAAGDNWNYAGYGSNVIIPDIRVSTKSSMSGATSVRIDQYWDLGLGYFMLGQNFLSSLNPEHTYYMQVVDARHPDVNYTNVVSFRVGPTLRALDTDKHVINSTRSLRFRSSSPVARVYVGNIELTDPADFGISWDGQTVTLSYEFLNKRSGGNTYTIKVLTTSGDYASTTFQVLTTAQGSASPRTGDESNLGLWAAFLLLSGTAVVVMVPKLRKQDF